MEEKKLWNAFQEWSQTCQWVDLTHPLSPQTPHWVGWPALTVESMMELDESHIFSAHAYTVVGQYGTHVDAPSHMVKGGRTLDEIELGEMVLPLCVIDKTAACTENADYRLTVADILAFEKRYGTIPENAFVVFQSGWSRRDPLTYDNLDGEGGRHFPGWSLEAVTFLTKERKVGGIGHETSDTEAPLTSGQTGYEVERAILAADCIQLELLCHVEQCPAVGALIFCTFPKVQGASGFPARAFALCPKG